MKVTLAHYYRSFKSMQGAFAGTSFLPAIMRFFVPDTGKLSACLFPPLGDVQPLAATLTLISLLLITLVVYECCCHIASKVRFRLNAFLFAGAAISVVVLIGLYVAFVRVIDVPAAGLRIPVSVGIVRTDFAQRTYPNWDDWDMLHDHGPTEKTVQLLWTRRSVWEARAMLWLAYTFTLSCFLAVVCIGIYQHAHEMDNASSQAP